MRTISNEKIMCNIFNLIFLSLLIVFYVLRTSHQKISNALYSKMFIFNDKFINIIRNNLVCSILNDNLQ